MTEIFRTIAGSRLYGTHTDASDMDYKAVHLPTKRDILIRPKRSQVINYSTGQANEKNSADDTDVESFELQRFLKLASGMQTIPVEMLFVGSTNPCNPGPRLYWNDIWQEIRENRHRILNRSTDSFVGYCKGQAVRYSMRGDRLATYQSVCSILKNSPDGKITDVMEALVQIEGVKFVPNKKHESDVWYLDVYGRQAPQTLSNKAALDIYIKPVNQAGKRVKSAMEAGGADLKALYHAMRIVDQGITLFRDGNVDFPAQNRDYLMKIRAGEIEMNAILDLFDEKLDILQGIGDNSPLAEKPDLDWIDDFVAEQYEKIVRA